MKHLSFFLSALSVIYCASAQVVWHHPDSLISLPHADSISTSEEYTVLTVVKSLCPDTFQLLWGITADDTLHYGVLTNARYGRQSGVYELFRKRDYSRWSILYYHTGCRMDTARSYTLWLGPAAVAADSAGKVDSLSAQIAFREFLYVPGRLSRLESAAWHTYLALKHGVTLDYAPYVSPAGDTLWSAEEDYAFYNRVVGIGSDSLRQWLSPSSSSLEQAKMHIVSATSLTEGEYVVLGDDDQAEEWSLMPEGHNRLLRSWRLRALVQSPRTLSLVWHPTAAVNYPDSVWLALSDTYGSELARLSVDSIVGDTAWWFSVAEIPSVCQIAVETLTDFSPESTPSGAVYDASSGTIALTGLDPDKVYSYAMYTNLGHLLFRPAPSRPDQIHVGALPNGIYRLEAFDDGAIVASVAVRVY